MAADGHLKDTRALIAEVADKFAGYADGASKTALAVELFGRTGAELIPILNGGAAGFADMDEQARKLGLTIDEETAKAAEYFNDQLAIVKKQAEGLATQFTVGLMPSLIAVADGFFATADSSDSAREAGAALGDMLVGLTNLVLTAAAAFRELTVRIADAFNRAANFGTKIGKDLSARMDATSANMGFLPSVMHNMHGTGPAEALERRREAEASAEKIEAMEINLDLATSFIATGNAARARVWLEEVMLEGSAAQKALAAQLLKKVDTYK